MRSSVAAVWLVIGSGCGRLGFADVASDGPAPDLVDPPGRVLLIPMDDDPALGTIATSDPTLTVTCAPCPAAMPGQRGGAYRFSGQAFVLDRPTLVGNVPYTVVVWMQAGTNGIAVAKPMGGGSTLDAFALFVDGMGLLQYETTIDGAFANYVPSATSIDGAWHHVALSWDGAMKRVYIDGALEMAVASSILDSTEPVQVGVDLDAGTPYLYYNGDLDELAFYDRALSDGEVAMLPAL